MNTNFKKSLMPFVVMVLGIAGAFTTMSMGKAKPSMVQQGYYFVSELDRCHKGTECSTIEDEICTWGSDVQKGKLNNTGIDCPVVLYKPAN